MIKRASPVTEISVYRDGNFPIWTLQPCFSDEPFCFRKKASLSQLGSQKGINLLLVKLQMLRKPRKSRTIRFYVSLFRFRLLNFILVNRAKISLTKRRQYSSRLTRQPVYWAHMKRSCQFATSENNHRKEIYLKHIYFSVYLFIFLPFIFCLACYNFCLR